MTTQPKLIIAPVYLYGELSAQYMMLDVYTSTDKMEEINLVSVKNHFNKVDILPKIDSVSKQRILHNIYR